MLSHNLAFMMKALGVSLEVKDATEFTDERAKQPVPTRPVLV